MTDLYIYNTLSRNREKFVPLKDGVATIYTCGPTVYSQAQIGNLRAFVSYDVLVKTLALFGFKVIHVMNLTDVDDKTIRASRAEGVELGDLTQRYIDIFFRDLDKLNIRRASEYPRATAHIPAMVALVSKLKDRGHTYESGGSTYFRISSFSGYGKLSGMDSAGLKPGARLDKDEYEKEDASDFVLWKGWKEEDGDVFWETEAGKGRPGWHIECSAMSMQYLGETVDIHGGGIDLIFPHHENEIAQSEAATGKKFVRYWVHNGWLLSDGRKMSKSLGNYHVLADVEKMGFNPLDLRYFFLTNHYRQQFNFTREGLDAAAKARQRVVDFHSRLGETGWAGGAGDAGGEAGKRLAEFSEALSDDLNTPKALVALHMLMAAVNRIENRGGLTASGAAAVKKAVESMDAVLGLLPGGREGALAPEEQELLDLRRDARARKDFKLSDTLRDRLLKMGIAVEDTPSGQRWKRADAGKQQIG